MALVIHRSGNRASAQISGEMTIYQAAELKGEMVGLLLEADFVDVDLAQVTEIDTAGVQLMLLLKREAQHLGKAFSFSHHSPSVIAVIDLLNLGGALGDPLLITR